MLLNLRKQPVSWFGSSPTGEFRLTHSKAILLFAREFSLLRSKKNDSFSTVAWDDIDVLHSSMAADMIETLSKIAHTQLIFYASRKNEAGEFASMFQLTVDERPQKGRTFEESVGLAINSAFQEGFDRVVSILEINPLLESEVVRGVFTHLGIEDECIVVGGLEKGGCYLIGMKSNYSEQFQRQKDDGPGWEELMNRLCSLNTMVVPAPPLYAITCSADLERLRGDVERRKDVAADFPRRTFETFRLLQRKYKAKDLR